MARCPNEAGSDKRMRDLFELIEADAGAGDSEDEEDEGVDVVFGRA